VVLPLAYGERVRGAVVISRRVRHEFSAEEMDLLRTFAVQAGIALQNAELFEEVQRGRWELWRLNQRIVTAQEEERRSLSRELHDEAGQALTALRIGLELIRQDLPAEARALHARLDEAVALAGSTTEQIRRMAQGLRPPALDTVGLDAALEELCRAFAAQTRLEVDYDGATLPPLPDLVGIHLYRCLQEALTNVARHARTDRAQVILQYDGETISLAVEDKGCGFEAATSSGGASSGGIGLAGMRERLDALRGSLEIVSRPGKGTRITASVPWREGE
jgi:signal transduction histidine kinase